MYAIRIDTARNLLEVRCSGRVSTEEAARAVSQAAALLEAGGGLHSVLCDLTAVTRGPGGLLPAAAGLAVRYRGDYRIAFVAGAGQRRLVQRFVRFTGIRQGMVVLSDEADAVSWLGAEAAISGHRLSNTELRHAEHLLAAARTGGPAPDKGPVAARAGAA